MVMRRLAVDTLLFALLLALLAACGGQTSLATMADLPAHPEATTLAPGANAAVDQIAGSLLVAGGQQTNAELARYTLPTSSNWGDVRAFYQEQLQAAGWIEADALAGENEALNTAGWRRGEAGAEQVVLIAHLPAELTGDPVLIVALYNE